MWEEIVSKLQDISPPGIALNTGFVSGGRLAIEGRVKGLAPPTRVTLALGGATRVAVSDLEGYFSVDESTLELQPGWQTITAQVDGRGTTAKVLVASPANRLGSFLTSMTPCWCPTCRIG
jgi:hypothetical protein